MYFAISKGIETCTSCTNDRNTQQLFLAIPTQIGDQMLMTEDHLQAIYSWLMADLSPGHLIGKPQLHTPQAMPNTWQYPMLQGKPSLVFNSFRNSIYRQYQSSFYPTVKRLWNLQTEQH